MFIIPKKQLLDPIIRRLFRTNKKGGRSPSFLLQKKSRYLYLSNSTAEKLILGRMMYRKEFLHKKILY